MRSTSVGICLLVFCACTFASVSLFWGDPPNRVGRLNFISGTVSFHPESIDRWATATP